MFQKADLIASPMYITSHRSKSITFTHPYLQVNATLLLRKPLPRQPSPITTIEDLIYQSEIRYGTMSRGVIYNSLKSSSNVILKQIWRNVERWNTTVLSQDLDQGINWVRNQKYGFILPDVTADYITTRDPCDLIMIDQVLPSRGFGFAVRHSDPFIYRLNVGIKDLIRRGRVRILYKKWWHSRGQCKQYNYLTSSSAVNIMQHSLLLQVYCSSIIIFELLK